MIVQAHLTASPPRLALLETDDLRSLKVRAHGAAVDAGALVQVLAPVGTLDEHGNALLGIEQLRRLAGDRARDARWRASFDAMVEHARGKGWVSGDGSCLQAHCEWQTQSTT